MIRDLREKAANARHFARQTSSDPLLVANLESYAHELEEDARKLEAKEAALQPADTESHVSLKIDISEGTGKET